MAKVSAVKRKFLDRDLRSYLTRAVTRCQSDSFSPPHHLSLPHARTRPNEYPAIRSQHRARFVRPQLQSAYSRYFRTRKTRNQSLILGRLKERICGPCQQFRLKCSLKKFCHSLHIAAGNQEPRVRPHRSARHQWPIRLVSDTTCSPEKILTFEMGKFNASSAWRWGGLASELFVFCISLSSPKGPLIVRLTASNVSLLW